MRTFPWLAAALVAVTAVPAPAQPPSLDDKDFPIDAAERGQLLDRLAGELKDRYVFADVAEKMAAGLKAKRAEYDRITSGPELAARLTTDLQAVSKDKHLRVRASATPFPKPKKA